jgi:predicted AAA+ superfamily ATPase
MHDKMTARKRFFTPPSGSFFLFGPRGTGKSHWTRAALPEARRIDLLDPATQRELAARPERLRERVADLRRGANVVLDEVQRVPELLSVVHSLIEERRGLRFVLTGSSARKLRREGTNLLGGRATVRTLHPYLAAELGAEFALGRALHEGTIPLVVEDADPAERLRGYVALYVREEVQTEGLVRDLGDFGRFLEALSFAQGQSLNLSSVARECGVPRATAAGFLAVVHDLLLAFELPAFTRRARRRIAQHPKFYFFDCGVFRSLRPAGPLDRPEEIDGAALEGLVAQHLRAWLAYGSGKESLHYWRTQTGAEVDFVVYGPSEFVAIEVKNTAKVRPDDLRGLRAFATDYPQARRLLLYRGAERITRDGVLCSPVESFLRRLRPGAKLPD